MPNLKIKDLNQSEMPRERLLNYSASALSDSELLSIILGSGGKNKSATDLAKFLLAEFGGFKGLLDANISQLLGVKNVGLAKACSILSLTEISLRLFSEKSGKIVKISKPQDVFNLLKRDFFGKKRELLYVLSLDVHNNLLGKDLVSVGTVKETILSPREVYRQALLRNAVSIILVHNHPFGNPNPSDSDVSLTQEMAQAGDTLNILLTDHIIVTDSTFTSLKSLNLFSVKSSDERR